MNFHVQFDCEEGADFQAMMSAIEDARIAQLNGPKEPEPVSLELNPSSPYGGYWLSASGWPMQSIWSNLQRPVSHQPTAAAVKPKKKNRLTVTHVAFRKYCTFCPKNGVSFEFSASHTIRNLDGIVTCPLLRAYNCALCNNAGGDDAHTEGYCSTRKNPKKAKLVHLVSMKKKFQ